MPRDVLAYQGCDYISLQCTNHLQEYFIWSRLFPLYNKCWIFVFLVFQGDVSELTFLRTYHMFSPGPYLSLETCRKPASQVRVPGLLISPTSWQRLRLCWTGLNYYGDTWDTQLWPTNISYHDTVVFPIKWYQNRHTRSSWLKFEWSFVYDWTEKIVLSIEYRVQ